MALPLSNLQEDTLYNKIPAGVRSQDVNGIIEAVVGAFQDQYSDLRSAGSDLAKMWQADGGVGAPHPCILLTYTSQQGVQITVELDIQADTPPYDGAALLNWATSQAGIDPSLAISAVHGTSTNRTLLIQTAQLLADTLGIEYVAPIDPSTDTNTYLQSVIAGYFSRLKIKGTPSSFEVAGRLVGFSDTSYIPLWGRLSPRYPSEPGNSLNYPDYLVQPEIFPAASIPDPIYDPNVTNDGPLYTWQSNSITLNSQLSSYVTLQVNGLSPFITCQVTDSLGIVPQSGNYLLSGGGPLNSAYVQLSSSVLVLAIAPGDSFNGMQVTVNNEGNNTFTLSVTYNLSAVKFRTSLFDLVGGLDIDSYGAKYVQPATANADLATNPNLYYGSGQYFVNSGAAVAPYRAWKLGSVPPPTVQTWPNLQVTPSSGPVIQRVQCTPTDTELDLTVVKGSIQSLIQVADTVKPAIYDARNIGVGFVVFDTVTYAAYQGSTILFDSTLPPTSDSTVLSADTDVYTADNLNSTYGLITATLPNDGLSYPVSDFTAQFYFTPVTGGPAIELGQTTDINNPGNVLLRLSQASPYISIVGNYNFNTQSFSFNVQGLSGIIQAVWSTTSQDFIRPIPSSQDIKAGNISFQTFPEDEIDSSGWYSYSDDYPWARPLTGGGTEDSHDGTVEDAYEEVYEGGMWMTSVDETGGHVSILARESDSGISPRVIINSIPASQRSQHCVGFKDVLGWTCDNDTFSCSDDTHNCSSSGLTGSVPYNVGVLRQNLVADLRSHWIKTAQQEGLINWFRLSDHPNAPWAIQATESTPISVIGNYSVSSRIWTNDRGWALNLTNQSASWSIQNDMGLGGTMSFWVNPGVASSQSTLFTCDLDTVNCSDSIPLNSSNVVGTTSNGVLISKFGPMEVWLNGLTATAIVDNGNGATAKVGKMQLYPGEFNFICLTGSAISDEDTPAADACATANINAYGTQIVDGVQLVPGMTVLLTAQNDPRGNGNYTVENGNWSRVAYTWPDYPYITVTGGNSNQGIWWLSSGSNIEFISADSIDISSDSDTIDANTTFTGGNVYFTKVNTQWSFGVGTLSNQVVYDMSSFTATIQAYPNYPYEVGTISASNQSLIFSDWRVWNKPKTQDELDVIRSPRYAPSSVNWQPWSIPGSRGSERYPIQVLPSGYAYPSIEDSQCYFNLPKWTVRYDSLGRFVGPEYKRKESLGNGTPLIGNVPSLGNTSLGISLGQHGVSSAPGDGGESGPLWQVINTPGKVLLLNNQWPTPPIDSYTYEQASPWPQSLPENTSSRQTIFVSGTDGFVYAVTVDDGPTSPSLVASKIYNSRSASEIANDGGVPGLSILDVPADAISKGGDGTHSLAVKTINGVPTVFSNPDSQVNAPIFMFSLGRRNQTLQLNDPNTVNNVNIWNNANTFGQSIEAVALNQSGLISLSFEGQLQPGKYNVQLQLGNAGLLDSGFLGYNFEATVDLDNPITSVTIDQQAAYVTYTFNGASTALQIPDISAATLSAALNALPTIASAGGVAVTGNFGGPWTVIWNSYGAQPIISVANSGSANVQVTQLSAGSYNTSAIQVITPNRSTWTIPITVEFATETTWNLNINFTNGLSLPQYNQVRAPVFYALNFLDSVAKLWKVNPTGPTLAQISLAGDYNPAAQGSWCRTIYADGTVSNSHELTLEVVSEYGDTVNIPSQPVGGLVTGSTIDKDSHITVSGEPVIVPNSLEDFTSIFDAITPQAILQT